MKQLSLKLLERQVRKTTWVPIGTMAFLFLAAVALLLYGEQENRFAQIQREFSDTVELNRPFIQQEALLGMKPALTNRVVTTISSWAAKYPRIQACLRLKMEGLDVERCSNQAQVPSGAPWVEKKIDNGTNTLATIQFRVTWQKRMTDYVPPILVLTLLVSLILSLILHGVLVDHLKKRIVTPLVAQIKQDERNEILAEAVQFIAHDVRRPFKRLRRALKYVEYGKNKDTFHRLALEIIPEVDQGMVSVEAMLKDVLDISGNAPLAHTELKPIELLRDAIDQIFKENTHADIEFTYDLTHESQVVGDREKLMRVFFNLIENAVSVLDQKGRIWINMRERLKGGVRLTEFRVGNNGPVISEEDKSQLFKKLFTKRKNGSGSGMGLAIVKKIVVAHGGDIWCESSEGKGTEFCFTIPTARSPEHTSVVLPAFSIDVTLRSDQALSNLAKIRNEKNGTTTEQNILVFDDDRLVHDCWQMSAKKQNVRFHYYWSWEDFLRQGAASVVQGGTAFVDIGFKGSDFNGYDIARRLRRLGIRKIYAITGNSPESVLKSGLFDEVFGKEVPGNIRGLVA